MTPTPPATVTWPEVIRDACWLWLQVTAGEQDDRLQAEGQHLIYAIDATVAALYAEPLRSAERVHLLGFLEEETLPDLAYTLGHICLRRAEQAGGFVLLPGHDEEFLRVFSAVQRILRTRLGDRQPSSIAKLLEEKHASRETEKLRRRITENDPPEGAEFIAAEFRILYGILRDERFELPRWYDFISRSSLRASADPGLELPDPMPAEKQIIWARDRWFDAIRTVKSRRRAALRIEDDAQALATLGWLNTELERRNDARRVVLLTLDQSLQLAALANPTFPGAKAIRDPRQFTRELPSTIGSFVENPGAESASYGVLEWLAVFLSPFSRGGALDPQMIERLVSPEMQERQWRGLGALFQHTHTHSGGALRLTNARAEWQRFIRLGINRYAVESMQNDPRLRMIADVLKERDDIGLQAALADYVVRTTSDASVSSLVAGLYISLGRRSPPLRREHTVYRMPIAIHSEPSDREMYIRFIDRAVTTKNLDAVRPFEEFIEKYRAHLYYSVYFAAIGNWEATETLARAALGFVDGTPTEESKQGATGVEVAYVLAVACRHRIRRPEDLSRAEAALQDVEVRRQRAERGQDPRLAVERVALDLLRAFATLLLGPEWEGTLAHRMTKEEMLGCLGEARVYILRDEDRLYKDILTKQILSNILVIGMYEFMAAPMGFHPVCESREFIAATLELEQLKERFRRGDGLAQAAQSRYVDILIGFGRWVTGNSTPLDVTALRELIAKAQRDEPEMPYDREKYRALGVLIAANSD